MSRIEPHEWVEIEKVVVAKPGWGTILVELRGRLSPSFYAFRAALLYSIHKYAALFDWSVLDEIEV